MKFLKIVKIEKERKIDVTLHYVVYFYYSTVMYVALFAVDYNSYSFTVFEAFLEKEELPIDSSVYSN